MSDNPIDAAMREIEGYDSNHIDGVNVKCDILEILHRNLRDAAMVDVAGDKELRVSSCKNFVGGYCWRNKKYKYPCECVDEIADDPRCPAYRGKEE